MRKGLSLAIAVGVALCTLITAEAFAQPDGAALLEERCSVCHPSARPKSKQKTVEQWDATVTRMMANGARLTEEEKQILVQHLSKNYKP